MTDTIQVRIRPNTLEQLKRVQRITHAPSTSDAVRRAVEISDLLVNAVEQGDKVIIEGKDGTKRRILITGINT